jgi:uncharacterized caspase-like protein
MRATVGFGGIALGTSFCGAAHAGTPIASLRDCETPVDRGPHISRDVLSTDVLIICNSEYSLFRKLVNPKHDADCIQEILGNDATKPQLNCKKSDMEDLIRSFGKRAEGRDIVFYFAGHGYRTRGMDYLIPTDAEPKNPDQWVSMRFVLDQLKGCKTRILILDCCRVEPVGRAEAGKLKAVPSILENRDAEELQSALYDSENTVVWYSAGPDHAAFDEPPKGGCNSPFAQALVEELRQNRLKGPHLAFEALVRTIRSVMKSLETTTTQRQKSHAQLITKRRTERDHLTTVVALSPNGSAHAEQLSRSSSRSESCVSTGLGEEAHAASRSTPAKETANTTLAEAAEHMFAYVYEKPRN